MNAVRFDTLEVGSTLPSFAAEPLSRLTLALYAGASGDHNPIHVDSDFATRAGMPDVFAHGMLSMAWLGRLLTQWVDQRQLRSFGVRFQGITHLGHQIRCTGRVVEKFESAEGEPRLKVEIQTANQYGDIRIVGEVIVAA